MITTIDVTCSCGRVLKAPAQYAGKKGRCKGCGAVILIPDDPPPETFAVADSPSTDAWGDLGSPSDEVATLAAVAASIETEDDDDEPPASSTHRDSGSSSLSKLPFIPFEPWSYEFLDTYARWTMGIGMVLCALILIVGLLLALSALASGMSAQSGVPALGVITGLSVMAFGALSIIPFLLASAPIFLAVDAARHLRALRYGVR